MENFKTFNELNFKETDHFLNGVTSRMMFDNGYGVSVIRHKYSYGGPQGLYEMAVIDSDGVIVYDTEITNDVIGHLTEDEVTEYMIQVQKL